MVYQSETDSRAVRVQGGYLTTRRGFIQALAALFGVGGSMAGSTDVASPVRNAPPKRGKAVESTIHAGFRCEFTNPRTGGKFQVEMTSFSLVSEPQLIDVTSLADSVGHYEWRTHMSKSGKVKIRRRVWVPGNGMRQYIPAVVEQEVVVEGYFDAGDCPLRDALLSGDALQARIWGNMVEISGEVRVVDMGISFPSDDLVMFSARLSPLSEFTVQM
jgi:hypothetical protein